MPTKQNIELWRNSAKTMNYIHNEDMTGGRVLFTIKTTQYDSDVNDTSALVTKEVTSFTAAGTTASWTLTDTDMFFAPGNYHYDIVLENSSGQAYPPIFYGRCKVIPHPTNRSAIDE